MDTSGFALSNNSDGSWSYRSVRSDWPLAEGEVFYLNYESFPQDARDWIESHIVW